MSISRRSIVKAGAAAPALMLFACGDSEEGRLEKPEDITAPAESFAFGVYVRLDADGDVAIITPNAEMGQGTYDGLAKILAEELDVDWSRVRIELSGADKRMVNPKLYGQITGNSYAVRGYRAILAKAGAAMRQMLRQAGAAQLGVSVEATSTLNGHVRHGDQSLAYGALAADAARQPVPENPPLKDPSDYKLIGRDLARKETETKVDGRAVYGIDVNLPNMLVAAMAMPRQLWGTPTLIDDARARAREGVIAIAPVRGGYAVIADDFWTAKKAADEVIVGVEEETFEPLSTEDLDRRLEAAINDEAAGAALYIGADGAEDLERSRAISREAIEGAAQKFFFLQSVPALAHGALEPLACTALFEGDRLTLWAPHQNPPRTLALAAKLAGLPEEAVTVHRTFLGGSFGRKWHLDFVQQAVEAAMAVKGRPVKLIWTREQDTRHDFYRPAYKSKLMIGVDADGMISSWTSVVGSQSLSETYYSFFKRGNPDHTIQKDIIYDAPKKHLETRAVDLPLPIGWWRSVSHAPNMFFIETAIDEVATKLGVDPIEFRLNHLSDERARNALLKLRENMDWASARRNGAAMGVALAPGYESYCAVGVTLSLNDGAVALEKIWAVIDCGFAIEPENVRRQIAGGVIFGLGAALDGRLEIIDGEVQAGNLHEIGASSPFGAPVMDVDLIGHSVDAPSGGVGEVGTPAIAPALCNAIAAAGGPRIRDLPVSAHGLSVTV